MYRTESVKNRAVRRLTLKTSSDFPRLCAKGSLNTTHISIMHLSYIVHMLLTCSGCHNKTCDHSQVTFRSEKFRVDVSNWNQDKTPISSSSSLSPTPSVGLSHVAISPRPSSASSSQLMSVVTMILVSKRLHTVLYEGRG